MKGLFDHAEQNAVQLDQQVNTQKEATIPQSNI